MTRAARLPLAGLLAGVFLSACFLKKPETAAHPVADSTRTSPPRDTALENRVGRLELKLLERDAQVEDLQTRLDEARQEVVRAMAKLQTLASRAEAASGMAEAEIALQTLKTATGSGAQVPPEVAQATRLLAMSTDEFDKQNYGGALYLANQAKGAAGVGRARLASGDRQTQRPGEVAFAVPVRLQATAHANVREGPGTAFRVAFSVEGGTALTGYSYAEDWVRVADETGRGGWMSRRLVSRASR